jgi:DHA1 family bicyclomycin/chloramphenicol resistance-like MFS transporter
VNFGFAGLLSPLVGLLGIASARPMGIVMTCTAAAAVVALWVLVRPRTVPPIGP